VCLEQDSQGNIYAGGHFTNDNNYAFLNKWSATEKTWSEVTSGGNGILLSTSDVTLTHMIEDSYGNLYVALNLHHPIIGHSAVLNKWDGNMWTELPLPINNIPYIGGGDEIY